jgi:pimeloyl-ACP methyl ester carboxylesterase
MIPGAAALTNHHHELSMPVAIMAGVGDKIVDCDSQAGRLGAELPGSILLKVPGTGHMIHYAVPERVAAVIRDLARAAPSRVEAVERQSREQGTRQEATVGSLT